MGGGIGDLTPTDRYGTFPCCTQPGPALLRCSYSVHTAADLAFACESTPPLWCHAARVLQHQAIRAVRADFDAICQIIRQGQPRQRLRHCQPIWRPADGRRNLMRVFAVGPIGISNISRVPRSPAGARTQQCHVHLVLKTRPRISDVRRSQSSDMLTGLGVPVDVKLRRRLFAAVCAWAGCTGRPPTTALMSCRRPTQKSTLIHRPVARQH